MRFLVRNVSLQVWTMPRIHPAAYQDLQGGSRGGEGVRGGSHRLGQERGRFPQVPRRNAMAGASFSRQVRPVLHTFMHPKMNVIINLQDTATIVQYVHVFLK